MPNTIGSLAVLSSIESAVVEDESLNWNLPQSIPFSYFEGPSSSKDRLYTLFHPPRKSENGAPMAFHS